jgi:multiple sugar transport system ATP-binding protein
MAGIVFEGVGKVFPDGTSAVCDLDLAVPDGEFCVLVGPSGSGKSTALRMVAGLEEVTTGTIRIGDRDVTDVAPRDRDIAMVFQSYALYPHMSVESNLGFALKMAGEAKPSIRDRVAAAGDRLGIGELLHRRPRALSGGQRQRVALGRAIVRAPQAFLMDEPLSNLDAKLRVEMRAYIARLHQELGTTVLYVTHDQVEAMTMGDRVAVMRDGRLEQVDTPQALYDRPANLFVAAFIGSPAMNLVRGRLEEDGGRLAVWLGAHRIALPGARPELYARASEDVIVGIRPEALDQTRQDAGEPLELRVALTESLGSDTLVALEVEAAGVVAPDVEQELAAQGIGTGPAAALAERATTLITARLPPHTHAVPGRVLAVRVDPRSLHFFDPETELAV